MFIKFLTGSSPVFRYCEINPVLQNATMFEKENIKVFQSYQTNDGVIELSNKHRHCFYP